MTSLANTKEKKRETRNKVTENGRKITKSIQNFGTGFANVIQMIFAIFNGLELSCAAKDGLLSITSNPLVLLVVLLINICTFYAR